MISTFDIYLFGLLYNISKLLGDLLFLSFIGASFCLVSAGLFICIEPHTKEDEEIGKKFIKFFKVSCCLVITLTILKGIAPSKETVIAMATIPPVINNEKVQELPENVLDFINEWLKEYTPKNHEENNSF